MLLRTLRYLPPLLLCLVLLTACDGFNPLEGLMPDDAAATGENGDATDDDGTTADDDNGATNDGSEASDLALSGRIDPAQAAKHRPRSQEQEYPYTVVAQSDATGEVFRGETDENGDFEINLPDDEMGNSFIVTVLGPDGRAVGPVIFDESGDDGVTGLAMDRAADLGTIDLPDDPTTSPILPGSDGDADDLADPDLAARLDQNGVPIGLTSFGKGDDAAADSGAGEGMADIDRDGLIGVFDADDDGDGIVDDFDEEGDASGVPEGVRADFFMNLKIDSERANTYYTGTKAEIDQSLSTDTIITFGVMSETGATHQIVEAKLLETPGPAYLPTADVVQDGAGGLQYSPWVDVDYAFEDAGDRFEAFVRPNDVMDAGDSFTAEVTFDDGTLAQYTRMINFVFKNIPELVQYGAAGALTDFDVTSPTINGSQQNPIPFDGAEDLVLVFYPPPDENGDPLTDMYYMFEIFFTAADDGRQLNADIDTAATWPTPIAGMDGTSYRVELAALGPLAVDGTYTEALPQELFVDTVELNDGTNAAVGSYTIDIAAQSPTGNAAIMLNYAKQ